MEPDTTATFSRSTNPDADFLRNAAEGGLLEVKLGELVASKAVSMEVKNFAQQMMIDHGKANDELKYLAQQKGIELPVSFTREKQEKYDEFVQKDAENFDKDYIDYMVKDHKTDIELFEKEAKDGKDADVKNWAAQKLPVLKHHLEMAQQAQESQEKSN